LPFRHFAIFAAMRRFHYAAFMLSLCRQAFAADYAASRR